MQTAALLLLLEQQQQSVQQLLAVSPCTQRVLIQQYSPVYMITFLLFIDSKGIIGALNSLPKCMHCLPPAAARESSSSINITSLS